MSKVNMNAPITGMNLYQDKKSRIIYYSPILKKAWYIPKFDFRRFERFKSRYITVLAAFLVLATIFKDWLHLPLWIPVVIALALWIGLEYSFYHWLNTLVPVKSFDKTRVQKTLSFKMNAQDRTKYILKMLLYFVLGILLVVNGYEQGYDAGLMAFCWVALVFCCGYGLFLGWQIWSSSRAKA